MEHSPLSSRIPNLEQVIEVEPLIVTSETSVLDVVIAMNSTSKYHPVLSSNTQKSEAAYSYALVVDQERLEGIFTTQDLVQLVARQIDLAATPIAEVMTKPVITLKQEKCTNILGVWSYLQQHSLTHLPILDNSEQLLGIITLDSLEKALGALDFIGRLGKLNLQPATEQYFVDCSLIEKDLERFFQVTPTLFCIAGFDGYFQRLNPIFQQILGFSEEELLSKPFIEFVHPEDRDRTIAEVQSLTQGNQTICFENRYLTKDGSYRWLSWTSTPYIEDGKIYAAARDITDRKQAEIQLKQERDFTSAILDTVGALVAVLDREGKIVKFNHTCEQITGYSFAEVKNKSIWDFLILPRELRAVKAVFARLLTGQVPKNYENHWVGKDGSYHLISWSNTALFNAQGQVEFIITTGIDVTEQRRIQKKLEHQYRQTQLLAEVTRKIRMSSQLEETLHTAVTEVQNLLICDRAIVVQLQKNGTVMPISEAIIPDLPSMLGYELADPLFTGEHLNKYRQGQILAINNVSTAAIAPEIKQLLRQFAIKAELIVPILSQDNIQGLLVIHQCHNPRSWQEHEIQLLQQLADQIGVALSQAQLLENLEELVAERTSELTITNVRLQEEIKERQLTETALRENQEKLQGILDNADEAIISIDEHQYIRLFNQGAEKIFGYNAYEVLGKPLDILLPRTYHQTHRQCVNDFANSTQSSRAMRERNRHIIGRRKNGEEFPAEASIAKLQVRDGLMFTVMLKDITERQEAEEKLKFSQALLARAEKIAKIGSWEYDFKTKKLSWSEELFHILGFDPDRNPPSAQEINRRIHPKDMLLVKNTLQQGHIKGIPWKINYRVINPNGSIKYLESRGEPTVDDEDRILKVLGTIMDISDRIRAEQSQRRSEEQLRLITDSLPILIAYIDKNQRYRYNNQTYESWFGKPRTSLKGKHMAEVVGEANYQKMLPYVKTALTGKNVIFEIEATDTQGSSYWANITYIPDFTLEGKVKGFFSMVDDITERKAIEQMKSEFVSIASHEMRTPLTSIHGVLKLLCADLLGTLSPKGLEMARIALRNADRLSRLINDVLDLERMESGRETIEKQQCNSSELIQQAVETMSAMAHEQDITLETNAQSIQFLADGDRIMQTLTNLISNAIKFSPPQSQVLITSQLQDNDVLFIVKDRGRGIPADKLESIFERFQQVDSSDSRKKGGTGLGLAICRHIVEQHNGKIWVESILGQGSTFYLTVPQL
ncbi:MAG: hypothetical protein Tsb0014_01080 [Pleurocapsa sp.]